MTAFRISPDVADAFPDTLIAVVTATGLNGREPWPHTTEALESLEAQLADGTWAPAEPHVTTVPVEKKLQRVRAKLRRRAARRSGR